MINSAMIIIFVLSIYILRPAFSKPIVKIAVQTLNKSRDPGGCDIKTL